MGLKKSNSNTLVILAILFSFLSMIAIEAKPRSPQYTNQLEIEYDNYFNEYLDLNKRLYSIESDFSQDDLIINNTYANTKMLKRDIQKLLNIYLKSDPSGKDVVLVDIGFNLSLFAESIFKLENSLY